MYWKVYENKVKEISKEEAYSEVTDAVETEFEHADGEIFDLDGVFNAAIRILEKSGEFGMSKCAIIKSDEKPVPKVGLYS